VRGKSYRQREKESADGKKEKAFGLQKAPGAMPHVNRPVQNKRRFKGWTREVAHSMRPALARPERRYQGAGSRSISTIQRQRALSGQKKPKYKQNRPRSGRAAAKRNSLRQKGKKESRI